MKTLEENIKDTTTSLLNLVDEKCWNKISDNCNYILTNVKKLKYSNFHELRKIKQKINSKKNPQDFNSILKTLSKFESDLFDVVLYIFKADTNQTIIEIEYLRKSDLDFAYYETIKESPTMFHAKISLPTNQNPTKKFDINWQNINFFDSLKVLFRKFNKK